MHAEAGAISEETISGGVTSSESWSIALAFAVWPWGAFCTAAGPAAASAAGAPFCHGVRGSITAQEVTLPGLCRVALGRLLHRRCRRFCGWGSVLPSRTPNRIPFISSEVHKFRSSSLEQILFRQGEYSTSNFQTCPQHTDLKLV